jgi:hypothetical protein
MMHLARLVLLAAIKLLVIAPARADEVADFIAEAKALAHSTAHDPTDLVPWLQVIVGSTMPRRAATRSSVLPICAPGCRSVGTRFGSWTARSSASARQRALSTTPLPARAMGARWRPA